MERLNSPRHATCKLSIATSPKLRIDVEFTVANVTDEQVDVALSQPTNSTFPTEPELIRIVEVLPLFMVKVAVMFTDVAQFRPTNENPATGIENFSCSTDEPFGLNIAQLLPFGT